MHIVTLLGVIADNFLVCSFMGKPQLLLVCLKKSFMSLEDKGEKLNMADPKVLSVC